jgi:sugar-specific transcriptional regulator TrmB
MNVPDHLEALGLTRLEALAYTYLVANPGVTGYRVARGIGKPTANVYRALESLGRKNAVVHDRAATPKFRAISPDDFLARLEREFRERKDAAARELSALEPEEPDERIYMIATADMMLARARILLSAARRLVWIDAPAEMVAALKEEIVAARARGVRVLVLSRSTLAGAAPKPLSEELAAHDDTLVVHKRPRPGAPAALRVVSDARESLMAALSPDGTRARDAVWTRAASVAPALHEAMAAEWLYARIEAGVADGLSVDEVESAFEACRELRERV